MNWSDLLARAGIPDSPGRTEAVRDALSKTEERARLLAKEQERKASRGKGRR